MSESPTIIPYVSNTTLSEIAARLSGAKKVVLTTHAKPDGDAIGGTVALARALGKIGIADVQVWYIPPVPHMFLQLCEGVSINQVNKNTQPPDNADLIVILDTGAYSQLRDIHNWLDSHSNKTIVVDHHIQGDPELAAMRYIDARAAAVTEIVAELISKLDCPLDIAIAKLLYIGIATDTGWFKYSNTRAETFELAAKLLKIGVDHPELYKICEQSDKPSRLKLLARALATMEITGDNEQFVILKLVPDDYIYAGASIEESHGFADLPHSIGSVEMTCLLAQSEPGWVKLSLRSKPGDNAIDVNALASRFGGGGHARASGAKITGDMDDAYQQLLKVLAEL